MNSPDKLVRLKAFNPDIRIEHVGDPGFSEYGILHTGLDKGILLNKAREIFNETDGTSYSASNIELENSPELPIIRRHIFGESEIQAGCCWGYSTSMKGMEYHRSSELLGAATDMVLILGRLPEVANGRWDSSHARFFFIPAGSFVELFSTTLHLAPCRVDENPFCAVIILPAGTNTPLDAGPAPAEEAISAGPLWMKNKWMLTHPEGPAAARGAYVGIDGVNWEVLPIGENLKQL
ncbi:MAG: DUF4867 family protein [Spirochaetales bacterium]|nr:DUF4867 family protein [Spirochaetales bacterium]